MERSWEYVETDDKEPILEEEEEVRPEEPDPADELEANLAVVQQQQEQRHHEPDVLVDDIFGDGESDQDGLEEAAAGGCLCNPTSTCHRLIALCLMCSLGFGSYFCYDNPGALQDEIKTAMGVTTLQFENLYALYSWPNVFLPILGGYLLDNVFGIRLGACIFAGFICAGQLLTALGAFMDNFLIMQVSRFVFGIGGESLAVAQNTYASVWFRGVALNMVFGLQVISQIFSNLQK